MALMETRDSLGQRVDAAHFGDEVTIITKNGSPRAVIVSFESYQHLMSATADHSAGARVGQTVRNRLPNRSESGAAETAPDLHE